MKVRRHYTRRQVVVPGFAIALIAVVGVVPWRVVAQDSSGADRARPKGDAVLVQGLPEPAAIEVVVKLEHARAKVVSEVIQQKYRDFASTKEKGSTNGASRREPQFKQMLTVEPFESTNSVVISAPQALLDDVTLFAHELDGWGDLKGRFIFDGDIPQPRKLRVGTSSGGEEMDILDESLVVGEDRSLANVVVWVRTADVAIHPSYEPRRKEKVIVRVKDERLNTHILPYWTGQPWQFENEDRMEHGLGLYKSGAITAHYLVSEGKPVEQEPLTDPEPRPCPIEITPYPGLPRGYLVVQPHPYVAVSGKDGRFEIKHLPIGVSLEFQVWQEKCGYVQRATIGGKDAGWKQGRFTMSLKPGANDLGEIRIDGTEFDRFEPKPSVDNSSSAVGAAQATAPLGPALAEVPEVKSVGNTSGPTTAETRINVETNKETKKIEQQLAGHWRGGLTNCLVSFNADGTFEGPTGMLSSQGSNASDEGFTKGKWLVELDSTQENGRWLNLDQSFHGAKIRGLPLLPPPSNPVMGTVSRMRHALRILHLDEKFLRLDRGDGVAIFFKRVEKVEAEKQKIDPSLPADVRMFAELASFTPEEAAALAVEKVDYFKKWNIAKKQLDQILRLSAAQRGQIDFAELFQLDKNEMEAYSKLYLLTGGDFNTVRTLIEQGQLTELELRAAKKVDALSIDIFQTMSAFGRAIHSEGEVVYPPFAPSVAPRLRALGKLNVSLASLSNYLNAFLYPVNQ